MVNNTRTCFHRDDVWIFITISVSTRRKIAGLLDVRQDFLTQ